MEKANGEVQGRGGARLWRCSQVRSHSRHTDFGSVYHCLHCGLPPSGGTEADTVVLSALLRPFLYHLKLLSSELIRFVPLCLACPLGLSVQGMALSAVT